MRHLLSALCSRNTLRSKNRLSINSVAKPESLQMILGNYMSFAGLLFFSLAPGFAKYYSDQLFFIYGYFSCGLFIFFCREYPVRFSLNKTKLFMLIFVLYGLILALFNCVLDESRLISTVQGIGTFILPITLALFVGKNHIDALVAYIPKLSYAHACIALVIYPLSPFADLFSVVGVAITEGVMAFRLSSVSGSLSFSTLMAIALTISVLKITQNKHTFYDYLSTLLFLICVLLAQQRSIWIYTSILFLFLIFRGWFRKMQTIILIGTLVIGMTLTSLKIQDLSTDAFELITSRLSTIIFSGEESAISERSSQWLGVVDNLTSRPWGAGPGQIGQSSREDAPWDLIGIPDGDYFRIISEAGPFGFVLVLLILRNALFFIRFIQQAKETSQVAIPFIFCCMSLQALGSNVTEFYFINFIFFSLLMNYNCKYAVIKDVQHAGGR